MPYTQLISSFNAGELSPFLDAQVAVEKYPAGCRVLENFIPLPYGGVMRRPGTQFIAYAKTGSTQIRLIPFVFSETTRYVLELGPTYARVYNADTRSQVGADMTTPYAAEDLREIQFVQFNDIMYFAHRGHPVQRLTRSSATSFTWAEVEWDFPPFGDINTTSATLTLSAAGVGSTTLTASAGTFVPEHVGAYILIIHRRGEDAAVSRDFSTNGTSGFMRVFGTWSMSTGGIWGGNLEVQRTYNLTSTAGAAGPWETIASYQTASDRNVTTGGTEIRECQLRLKFTNRTAGSATSTGTIEASDTQQFGLVKVTAYTDAQHVTVDVINPAYDISATSTWAIGAFNEANGYPRAIAAHDGRLMFGGTAAQPQSVWGSALDDFQNFRIGALDDNGIFFTIAAKSTNPIQWMASKDGILFLGKLDGEGQLSAASASEILSPSSVRWQATTKIGSKAIAAVELNDSLLFLQRQGRKVREISFNNDRQSYTANDLTILSEHVTRGEIAEWAAQTSQESILWGVRGDGQLVGLTYEREQGVAAWHRHVTDGSFESVCVIPGTYGDEVWLAVRRQIASGEKLQIERFTVDYREALETEDKSEWRYLDAWREYEVEGGNSISSVPVGPRIQVISKVDAAIFVDGEADEFGEMQFANSTTEERVIAGRPFVSTLRPMKLHFAAPNGSSRNKKAQVTSIGIQVLKSLGCEFRTGASSAWDRVIFRSVEDSMDLTPPTFTGTHMVACGGDYTDEGADVWIRQSDPYPLTIIALIPEWIPTGSSL